MSAATQTALQPHTRRAPSPAHARLSLQPPCDRRAAHTDYLPNRDCHAIASNGEICCHYKAGTASVSHPNGQCDFLQASDCATGLAEYKTEYVDQFAAVLALYDGRVPVAVVIEPDSLPNLVTNNDNPKCGNTATSAAYNEGIAYAVHKLAALAPSAALYMDAAHGGWLGWEDNAVSFAGKVAAMGIANELRGFAANVANYQALGVPCPPIAFGPRRTAGLPEYCQQHSDEACCIDPCGLLTQYNQGNNEMNYVQARTINACPSCPRCNRCNRCNG